MVMALPLHAWISPARVPVNSVAPTKVDERIVVGVCAMPVPFLVVMVPFVIVWKFTSLTPVLTRVFAGVLKHKLNRIAREPLPLAIGAMAPVVDFTLRS